MSSIPKVSTVINSSSNATVTISMDHYNWSSDNPFTNTPINVEFPLIVPNTSTTKTITLRSAVVGKNTKPIDIDPNIAIYFNYELFATAFAGIGENFIPQLVPMVATVLPINSISFITPGPFGNTGVELNNLIIIIDVNYISTLSPPPIIIQPTIQPPNSSKSSIFIIIIIAVLGFVIGIGFLAYKLSNTISNS